LICEIAAEFVEDAAAEVGPEFGIATEGLGQVLFAVCIDHL
jgi:hypothetical protein